MSPAALETSLLFAPVSTFLTVTRACGMPEPDGSVTFTFSVASCCAESATVSRKAKTVNVPTTRNTLRLMASPNPKAKE